MASPAKGGAAKTAAKGGQRGQPKTTKAPVPDKRARSAKRVQQHAANIAAGLVDGARAAGAAHAAHAAAAGKPAAKPRSGTRRAAGKGRAR